VSGQAGLPSTGVAAIVASVTAINGTGSAGTVTTGANSGGSAGTVTALQFGANDTVSNTVVIENGDDGKIKISASQSVHILLDIQGYFTAGNGNPAPGGFVPLPAGNVATIASPAAASTATVQVTGVAGVPATATAVFANLTVDNTGPGSLNSWLTPFPTGTTVPATSLNYDAASVTAIGTTVDLNAQGQLSIKFDYAAAPVSVRVDVLGYFDGQPSNAGFTPVTGRVFDSGVSPNVNIPAGGTVDVPVNGVAGLPAWSASISGVALNVQTSASSVAGSVTVVDGRVDAGRRDRRRRGQLDAVEHGDHPSRQRRQGAGQQQRRVRVGAGGAGHPGLFHQRAEPARTVRQQPVALRLPW
jgi:hypothetical protein